MVRGIVIVVVLATLVALCGPPANAQTVKEMVEAGIDGVSNAALPSQTSRPVYSPFTRPNTAWRWAFAAAAAGDFGSTLWLTHTGRGREGNPLYGNRWGQQLPVMTGIWARGHFTSQYLERRGKSSRARKSLQLGTAVHGGLTAWNIYQGVK